MTTTTFKGRPTLYKGIQMRSRLEADFAGALDRWGFTWEYEPDCYAGPDGQWLPDFRTQLPGEGASLVEVKPASLLKPGAGEDQADVTSRVDEILRRMTIAWLSEPRAMLQLVFWTYDGGAPDMVIAAKPNSAWQVQALGALCYLLWPGMGQMATLEHSLSREAS